jgi:hypothetical protein
MAEHMAKMKRIRRSWWKVGRRRELQKAISQCQEKALAVEELRLDLITKLSPQAFDEGNAALATEASRYGSFFARLLPRWWSLKRRVLSWFTQDVPSTAALLNVLRKLAKYHRCVDSCRRVLVQHTADLVLDADGEPDWAETLDALNSVDQLEQFGTKIPASIQAVLSSGKLSRKDLAAAAVAVAKAATALKKKLESARQSYDFSQVEEGPSRRINITPRKFAAWLGIQIEVVDRETKAIGKLCGLLAVGKDLPMKSVPGKVRALTELVHLRVEISRLAERMRLTGNAETIEKTDWSDLGQRAEGLLRFLDTWGRPLTTEVIQILSVPEVRARLEGAVRKSEAALAAGMNDSWQFLSQLFETNKSISTGIVLNSAPLVELERWSAARADDGHRIQEWVQFRDIQQEVTEAGVLPFLEEVISKQVTIVEACDAFQTRFLRLWLDALYERIPVAQSMGTTMTCHCAWAALQTASMSSPISAGTQVL